MFSKSLLLLVLAFGFASFGEEAPPQPQPSDYAPVTTGAPTGEKIDDVDDLITNKKMRAASGSKSKYSISTGLSYNAGNFTYPLGSVRPNISGATGTTDVSLLGASISGKYTISTQASLFAGLGVRWITPFGGLKVPSGYSGSKFDADNPGLTYQYLYRWLDQVQSAFTVSLTVFTNSNLLNYGYVTAVSFAQNNVYDIPHTNFSVGFSGSVGVGAFDKNDLHSEDNQTDYSFALSPFIEYKLTDRVDLHTDSNVFAYQHIRSSNRRYAFQKQTVNQSFGMGFSIARDFYLSPGISWVAAHMSSQETQINISASLNIF